MTSSPSYTIACAGATGYSGRELIRLAARHPAVTIGALAHSPGSPDQPISAVYPDLAGVCDLIVTDIDVMLESADYDAVFLALPHTTAMPYVRQLRERGTVVIDFSADYRLRDAAVFSQWYDAPHTDTESLPHAVYGLCEWYRDAIASATLIANPGCYPTSALLPLLPLIRAGVVSHDTIIIDAKSGVSGAGKKVTPALHFVEVNESFKAYGLFTHRHVPEIQQELSCAAATDVSVTFTPHLLPVQRGILSTIYTTCARGTTADTLRNILRETYQNAPFVRIKNADEPVELKHVTGTNFCDIYCAVEGTRVILLSVLDNLVKGAAGQALQNFNIRFGCDETAGLI